MAGNLFLKMDFDGVNPGSDVGRRPFTSQEYYTNSSIFLGGGASMTQAEVGAPTTVRVRVSNAGPAPVEDVRVEAYVLNPFIGLASPVHAVARLRSGLATIPPGSGTTSVTDPHVVECRMEGPTGPQPWVPAPQDLTTSGGHLCLVANCFADGDGGPLPDGASFDLLNDAHQGQRNIAVLPARPGGPPPSMDIQVLPPPDPEQETFVETRPLEGDEIAPWEWDVLGSQPEVDVPGIGSFPIAGEVPAFRVPGLRELVPIEFSKVPLEVLITVPEFEPFDGRVLEWTSGRMRMADVDSPALGRFAFAPVTEEPPGSVHAVDVVQRTADGQVLGGLRVITVVIGEGS